MAGRHADSGQATAETAAVLPALVLLTAMLLWGLLASVSYIQCVDAARAGARSTARGDPVDLAVAVAREVAPPDARVAVEWTGDLVRVRVSVRTAGPGPLAVDVGAEAVARAEEPAAREVGRPAADTAAPAHVPTPDAGYRRRYEVGRRTRPVPGGSGRPPRQGLLARSGRSDEPGESPQSPQSPQSGRPGRGGATDRGSATVWALFCSATLCAVFLAVLALGQAVAVRHRAAAAADLAALAAAERVLHGPREACAAARRVAEAQGARLLRCALRGEVANVTARVDRGPYSAGVRARAGPNGAAR